jgi:spore coat-associated protein N
MKSRLFTSATQGFGQSFVRVAIFATALVGGLALVSSSVFAALTATAFNTSPTSATAGNLSLIQVDNGSGFTTAIAGFAPGDTVNRFVNYTNNGTLAAQGLTLKIVDTVTSALTGSGTTGIQVTVSQCSVAWTAATGVCGGTTTVLGTSSALVLKTTPLALPVIPLTPANANILAGAIIYLQFSLSLPAGSEITANGVLPIGTVQGTTGSITWTLTETERNATTISS